LKENNTIKSFLMLIASRKEIVFAATWGTSIATVIAGKGFPPIFISLQSIVAVAMLCLSFYIYNDIIDRDMDAFSDKEKKKGRPIAHYRVTVPTAYKFVAITGIIGLGLCYIIGMMTFLISVVFYILYFLYSYPRVRFKTMFIMKNVITALLLPMSILIGGTAVDGRISPLILFSSGALYLFTFLIIPAVADCLDIEEDKAFGIKTIGGNLTWRQNLILFNSGIFLIIILTVLTYKHFEFGYITPFLLGITGIPLMVFSISLLDEDGKTASYKLRPKLYTYAMLIPLYYAIGIIF
jgi:4-hydroxybenzoate polyprenyltransferase